MNKGYEIDARVPSILIAGGSNFPTRKKEKPVSYTHLDVYKRQEYGLEQVYNVIDSRYRSRKPLIVTTNLPLDSLQNPLDTAHARIYDRLLEMCAPILLTGENFRRETAQAKLNRLKELMK